MFMSVGSFFLHENNLCFTINLKLEKHLFRALYLKCIQKNGDL